MRLNLLAVLVTQACVTLATVILLPLYNDPTNGGWNSIYAAIEAHTNVQFQIIVNPDDGPGTTTYPSAAYRIGMARLNGYSNVQTIGYVHTAYTRTTPFASYSKLIANVTRYAGWANYSPANISVQGIFFDEVLATPNAAAFQYMKNASAFAYQKIPSAVTPVVFNPGTLASTAAGTNYFNLADTIVEFENPYPQYKGAKTISTIPAGYKQQSAILVYKTPSNADLSSLVPPIVHAGIGAVYFGQDCCYHNFQLLSPLAAAVASS